MKAGIGNKSILHVFHGADGAQPNAALISAGGVLYGTTLVGGATGNGAIYRINP